MVAYFDSAHDRLDSERRGRFVDSVEAVRVGTVAAHDQKAADRWVASRDGIAGQPARGRGLSGAALERAMMQLAASKPDLFVWGGR